MNKEKFKIWMERNLNSKEITKKKYFEAINAISKEMYSWGLDMVDIYSLNETTDIDKIMQCSSFIEKNSRGNQMYSAALNHYKNFLALKVEDNVNIQSVEDVVLIKINKSYKEILNPEEVYRATSVSWVVSLDKTKTRDIKYYCAIVNNKIHEIYKLTGFEPDKRLDKEKRYILHGHLADEKLREQINGLNITDIHNGRGNPIKYTNIQALLQIHEKESYPSIPNEILSRRIDDSELVLNMYSYITSKGFNYSLSNIKNLYLSIRSKPFVIISGISGTGKTKIVQLFAESVGATEENGQFRLIPVRPDWSDSSELLGYVDLTGQFKKGPLTDMIEHAIDKPHSPHFVLLDEMNLARVEYYLSDLLSVMESRKRDGDKITSSQLLDDREAGRSIRLPENLYIIGTVNMDETTHPFSKKVLDRANTIEFNEIYLENFGFLEVKEAVDVNQISNDQLVAKYITLLDVYSAHKVMIEKISVKLVAINSVLKSINAQVGYRVRDEICFYMVHNAVANLLSEDEAMDFCYMQKILPRISGGQAVRSVLMGLKANWTAQTEIGLESKYPRSVAKVDEMLGRLDADGFTSFWIA